jgi:hypothetical protein
MDAAAAVVVAIPTLNEEQSIGDVVRGIPRHVVDRIIVADGGSSAAMAEPASRPRWRPKAPISSSSWMATAPTTRKESSG